jgi:hypothetical protein
MNVNTMDGTQTSTLMALIRLATITGLGAAFVAVLLAGRVAEPVIIVTVIVVASIVGWCRTPLIPARVRSHNQFTVVSRCGDGFVTIDAFGTRRVARRVVLDGPTS